LASTFGIVTDTQLTARIGQAGHVYFVGIDLAWGERSPTGVAVADADGSLVHLAAARDDADIVAQLAPYAAEESLLAIDAPLVVTNPTGNRPCEAALNRDFRSFEAGCHPSNTGHPWFAAGSRGARVAEAVGRPAIEVYPHAATVALFGLSKTLKYKQKPGRDVPQLRGELLRLMALVESLADASPPLTVAQLPRWSALRDGVEAATRKSELRRAEDPVDAVVCAYVALLATRRPADVTTYGDDATGCIVTPTLSRTASPDGSGRRSRRRGCRADG
jgi:predicted RNase H-like nuclease